MEKWLKWCYKFNHESFVSRYRDPQLQMTVNYSYVFNHYPAKLIYLIFQALENVSRYRDPQPQVLENYSHLFSQKLTKNLQIFVV